LTLANERLAAQWERLRRANLFKREIIGTVAHDLKNPLGVIMGRAEILTDIVGGKPFKGDMASEQIRHIQESGRRLTDMVDALLADAMADALDINLRLEAVDLSGLVNQVVETSRQSAENKQQKLSLSAPAPLIVMADHDRLWEAIDNLVSNAIKYTPPGGKVEITVAARGKQARVTVRDSGPGLSREDLARVFGRYQRLSAKPTAGESSTGLGLSIVKRIIDLHGGQVAAESAGPNKGATFSMSLPLERST
jgi:signal transduction histidine kinase